MAHWGLIVAETRVNWNIFSKLFTANSIQNATSCTSFSVNTISERNDYIKIIILLKSFNCSTALLSNL